MVRIPRFRIPRRERRRFQPPPMPIWLRFAVMGAGWALILFGIVGLFLPVLQGTLSLLLGLALMSVASQSIHLWLRNLFRRSPGAWKRMERVRRAIHRWLERWHHQNPAVPAKAKTGAAEELEKGNWRP